MVNAAVRNIFRNTSSVVFLSIALTGSLTATGDAVQVKTKEAAVVKRGSSNDKACGVSGLTIPDDQSGMTVASMNRTKLLTIVNSLAIKDMIETLPETNLTINRTTICSCYKGEKIFSFWTGSDIHASYFARFVLKRCTLESTYFGRAAEKTFFGKNWDEEKCTKYEPNVWKWITGVYDHGSTRFAKMVAKVAADRMETANNYTIALVVAFESNPGGDYNQQAQDFVDNLSEKTFFRKELPTLCRALQNTTNYTIDIHGFPISQHEDASKIEIPGEEWIQIEKTLSHHLQIGCKGKVKAADRGIAKPNEMLEVQNKMSLQDQTSAVALNHLWNFKVGKYHLPIKGPTVQRLNR